MANRAGSVLKTLALFSADDVSRYSLWSIMVFLSNVLKINFTHAAAIVSVMTGCISILLTPMLFRMHTFLGHYWMLSLSSLCLSIGWSFLAISTSSFFFKIPFVSCETGPLCVGDLQWTLFYASLALIAVGTAGRPMSLEDFLAQQITIGSQEDAERDGPQIALGELINVVVRFFSGNMLPFMQSWGARFGIPAMCHVGATLLFFRGSGGYVLVEPSGSPITRVFRVVVASCLKLQVQVPKDPRQLYEKYDHGNEELLPHTNRLRFLDKAAVLTQSQTIEEQEKQKWRLCSVTEVEETKIIFQMIPMCMTTFVCGLVQSVGNTYFLEQALNTNHKFLFITLIPFLLFVSEFSSSLSTSIFLFAANMAHIFRGLKQKYVPAIGIAVGMFIYVLCCIVAALVESMRLSTVSKTVSVFWLIPQFVLWGAMEGIVKGNMLLFVVAQAPNSMKTYMVLFTEGVLGVGIIASVISVYVMGRVSAEKEGQSWFGEILNQSRLDKYYWVLAALSFINLLFYGLVAIWFDYRELDSTREQEGEVDEEMYYNQVHED